MSVYKLRIDSEDERFNREVPLFISDSVDSMLAREHLSDAEVYSDKSYRLTVFDEETGAVVEYENVIINGQEMYDLDNSKRLFENFFGFVRISLVVVKDDISTNLASRFLKVMLKKTLQSESIAKMSSYVYNHMPYYLVSDTDDYVYGDVVKGNNKEGELLEIQLHLLYSVIKIYEESFAFFKANSRYTTIQNTRVDDFEKLQFMSYSTIQFIGSHPELLQQSYGHGIRVGTRNVIPTKTLISYNEISHDIYENQVVYGFLTKVYRTCLKFRDDIQQIIDNHIEPFSVDDEYVSSAYYLFYGARSVLERHLKEVNIYCDKLAGMASAYKQAMNVADIPIDRIPEPTSVLLSVPQYRRIYDMIQVWFKNRMFTLEYEKFSFSIVNASTLYEIYILINITEMLKSKKYELVSRDVMHYVPYENSIFKNIERVNHFVFENNKQCIELYYEPYIKAGNTLDLSEPSAKVGLYRNTTTTIRESGSFAGYYYTPDFIIKISEKNDANAEIGSSAKYRTAKFIVADAKLKHLFNVKTEDAPMLIYKYLFSLSTLNVEDRIIGLVAFAGSIGVADGKNRVISLYDLTPQNQVDKKRQFANVAYFTGSDDNKESQDEHIHLLDTAIGAWL
jgi:hypothetical protein